VIQCSELTVMQNTNPVKRLERISKYKSIFGKGYLPNFTEELFKVDQVLYGSSIVCKLEDLDGEEIKGSNVNWN